MHCRKVVVSAVCAAVTFAAAVLQINSGIAAEPQKPIQLFDGKSFEGWTAQGGKPVTSNWSIDDGQLALNGVGGSLFSKEQYGDFDLSFEWKLAPKGNSGVKYRVNYFEKGVRGKPSWLGCEYQIFDDASPKPTTKNSSGALYDLYSPSAEHKLNPPGEFNKSRIVVQGTKIQHWLNGVKLVDVDMASEDWKKHLAKSKFAPVKDFMKKPKGYIELQDHRSKVWFKNIELTPLDAE